MAPAMKLLGTDFGNGDQDKQIFQFDREFSRYRDNKLIQATERPEKHFLQTAEPQTPLFELALWFTATLTKEHPSYFSLEDKSLACHLTGTNIRLSPGNPAQLLQTIGQEIQEDFAVVRVADNTDTLELLHVCAPSGWAPEDKIGRSFLGVHQPVPDFGPVARAAPGLLQGCVEKGPFVRFVWTVEETDDLNHHPDIRSPAGRQFLDGNLCIRTERQVIHGFPEWNAFLFTIRVGFVRIPDLAQNPAWIPPLISGLQSMSPASREYKGLEHSFDLVIEILNSIQ